MVAEESASGTAEGGESLVEQAGSSEPAAVEVTLEEFDWGDLVQRGFFQGMVTGYVGAGLGLILFETQGLVPPDWLLIDVRLSIVCAVLAFARVWKTIREEHETAEQWDGIPQSAHDRVLDRVFEIPYLFAIVVLPFAAIAPQAFMVTLIVFYFGDNFYNAALARGAAARAKAVGLEAERGSYRRALLRAARRSAVLISSDTGTVPRTAMTTYFIQRSRYNSVFMALLLGALIVVTWLQATGLRDLAGLISVSALGFVLLVELLVEPLRNTDDRLWGAQPGSQPAPEPSAEGSPKPSEA